jgi:dolichyl-phosphate-mannose--protein O-mannosyl transferase
MRRRGIVPGLLFLAALALFAPRLTTPDEYIFDEVYHAYTAGQYVAGNADAYVWNTKAPQERVAYMWNHPPAGLLGIASGILIWGDNSLGWRFASMLFGAAGIVLTYLLALRLAGERGPALLAAGLLLVDGMYFEQSRVAMLDVFGVVFALAALLSLHDYLERPAGTAAWPIARTGLLLGLALATKWNAAYLSLACGLVVLAREARLGRRGNLASIPLGLALVPLAVYVAVYVPFFASGHGIAEWIELQKQIYYYHTRLEATHPWSSSFWQWPLAVKPVWYWVSHLDDGRAANIYAAGNPVLYWGFLPAVLVLAVRWWRSKPAALAVVLIGFFGQWLPWALVPRIAFAYHFLPAVPFGAIALAVVLWPPLRRGGVGRVLALGYVSLVLLCFVWIYPILTGIPLSEAGLGWRLLMPSWRPV